MPVDVLCIGHASYDVTMYLSEYPAENSKAETYDSLECGGGPAANAAYLLGLWGLRTAFAGLVGDDLYGNQAGSELDRAGVNISLLEIREGHKTPLSVVLVNTSGSTRTIINRKAESTPYHPDPKLLAKMKPRYLLLDGHELGASLDALREFPSAISVLDAGSLRPGTQALASKVDYLIASERFACQVAEMSGILTEGDCITAVGALRTIATGHIAITLGERGVTYADGDIVLRIPAFGVEAVDTTGAGDVFHGAFVYGLITRVDFPGSLALATTTAALSITRRGARTSIPTLQELEHFMAASDGWRAG